jgi:hypothetical protein
MIWHSKRILVAASALSLFLCVQAHGDMQSFLSAIDSGLEKEIPGTLMLNVIRLKDNARAMGLSEERITYVVVNHLKAHSIYVPETPDDSPIFLFVRIVTLGKTFYSIEVGMMRGVMYIELEYAFQSLATTWNISDLGELDPLTSQSKNVDRVMDHLDQLLDSFITDYVKANKERLTAK